MSAKLCMTLAMQKLRSNFVVETKALRYEGRETHNDHGLFVGELLLIKLIDERVLLDRVSLENTNISEYSQL